MDVLQIVQEMKKLTDVEAARYAAQHGIQLSIAEVRQLRPLIDEISISWLFTGIPHSFIEKVADIIGYEQTMLYLDYYKLR